ncbi:hypothetical protein [Paenibacillus sp. MBLB4367]|uniref:hypothetical protein n=1 Tax=Paenibacillus sp. MBLB4367 TaxID=3384767 RepID=UPI003907F1ED
MKIWILRLVSVMMISLVLAACGHTLPVATDGQLKNKKSLLVVTTPDLPADLAQKLDASLNGWRSSDKIAWKWLKDKTALDEDSVKTIRETAYDQVVVIGSSLFADARKEAEQLPQIKWTLLQQTPERSPAAIQPLDNMAVWQADAKTFDTLWNDWVSMQKTAGAPIIWITTAAHQVPAVWAPSEEAEQIVLYDSQNVAQWFQQLTFQAQQIHAKWIVLYTPEAAAELTKIRSLRIPFMDMTASTDYKLAWDPILNRIKESMLSDSWKPGLFTYSQQEASAQLK